jgi:hypothetical protein
VIRANGEPVAHAVDVDPGRGRRAGRVAVRGRLRLPIPRGGLPAAAGQRRRRGHRGPCRQSAGPPARCLAGLGPPPTEQVERDADDRPVLFSTEHYVPARFTIHVRRVRRSRLGDASLHRRLRRRHQRRRAISATRPDEVVASHSRPYAITTHATAGSTRTWTRSWGGRRGDRELLAASGVDRKRRRGIGATAQMFNLVAVDRDGGPSAR